MVTTGKSLESLKEKEEGIISHFTDDRIAVKLLAMGVLPGSRVALVRKASLGATLYIKVDNLHLAIRKNEAACIALR